MSYWILVWSGLRRRPTRTVLTGLSVVTAFVIVGALQGLNAGIDALVDSMSPAVLRVTSRVHQGAPFPVASVRRIETISGVASVTGAILLVGTYQQPRNVIPVLGVDIGTLFKIYPDLTVPAEELSLAMRTRAAVLVGRKLAEQRHWRPGDRISLHALQMSRADGSADWAFEIAGIFDSGTPELASWVVANYDYINTARARDKDTVMGVLVRIRDINQAGQVSQAIDATFENSPYQTLTQTEKEFTASALRQIGDIKLVVTAIICAILFALLFLTANSLAQSVRERMTELAVLKAVGFPDSAVRGLVLAESLLICWTSGLIGLGGAALLLPRLLSNSVPSLFGLRSIELTTGVFITGMALAALVALAGGIPLARRAGRIDVATALSRT
jgi:putative ABC transport system permease protein